MERGKHINKNLWRGKPSSLSCRMSDGVRYVINRTQNGKWTAERREPMKACVWYMTSFKTITDARKACEQHYASSDDVYDDGLSKQRTIY